MINPNDVPKELPHAPGWKDSGVRILNNRVIIHVGHVEGVISDPPPSPPTIPAEV